MEGEREGGRVSVCVISFQILVWECISIHKFCGASIVLVIQNW